MEIVSQDSFVATPWKNGGGITREVMRFPSTGETFEWRISVARIDSGGPFSDFSGYRRTMVLLNGAGVRLTSSASKPIQLCQRGDCVDFDGGLAIDCELLQGGCTDLNFMVSESIGGTRTWVQSLTEPLIHGPETGTTLLFLISGGLIARRGSTEIRLQAWDFVRVEGTELASFEPVDPRAPPLVFCATLAAS